METAADNPERDDAPHSPGAILAAERERQGLSRADIAQRLHMSASQIEAIEASDYEHLPRGPFLRGFIRNYARSLGLDAEVLVGLLAEDAPPETAPRIVVPSQNIRFDPLGARLGNPYVKAAGILAAVVVFGFAAIYWWVFVRAQEQVTVTKPMLQPAKVVAPAAQPDQAPKAPDPSGEPAQPPAADGEQGAAGRAAAAPPAASPAPAAVVPSPVPAPGEGLIRLTFRGPAWVEIVDSRGKVIDSRTHAGGSSAELTGKPPFDIVIGNAAEVRLTYNGQAVDLEPHTRVAVARLTLK